MSRYENFVNNLGDISKRCGWGDYYSLIKCSMLGSFAGEGAFCFGLACMWGQAVLAEDVNTFYRRLDVLTKHYPDEQGKMLSDLINERIKERKNRKPNFDPYKKWG